MKKLWVKVAIAVAAVLILVVVLIPFLVNADTFRPRVEDQLSSALGRKVTLGHLGFSVFGGSLDAENISIADDPAFSATPFLQAKSLRIGVEIGALIFNRQVHITRLTLDTPAIQLIQGEKGNWNYSSIGQGAPASTPAGGQQAAAMPELTVGELRIKDGSATVAMVGSAGKPFVYSGINLTVQQFSFARQFPFKLSANLPGNGTFQLTGNAGPLAQKDAADTPFNADVEVKHLDPVAAGFVEPSQGISMVLDVNTQVASDGKTLTNKGRIEATRLKLAKGGSPAPEPVKMDYTISNDLATRKGRVSDLSIHAGSATAHLTGTYQAAPKGMTMDLHMSAPDLPVDQIEKLLPAFGVQLPSGSGLKGGTLKASLAITGPAASPVISGPVEVDNTVLEGFDLGSKIQGLNPFGTKGAGTAIQTVRADVKQTLETTELTNIYVSLDKIGTATGSGTVSSAGALDFKVVAQFSAISGVTGVAGKAVNAIAGQATGVLGGLFGKKNQPAPKPGRGGSGVGIPITITGTTANPSIHANPLGMFKK